MRLDNVTDIEKKESQLRQAQKMETVGTLAGGLAHDFNNVLGGITGSLSILKFKLKKNAPLDPEIVEKYLNTIEQSGNRAKDMVSQLLALSRKQELSFTKVDLNSTMKNVMKIF